MNAAEMLIALFVGVIVLGGPLVTFVLALVAFTRSGQVKSLAARVSQLENRLAELNRTANTTAQTSAPSTANERSTDRMEQPILATQVIANEPAVALDTTTSASSQAAGASPQTIVPTQTSTSPTATATADPPVGWETFVGQKAFGWLAVILFVFSAAFFLRYAFQNNWIGPVGRVAIGELVGVALAVGGVVYYRRGLSRFSGMLTSAGIVVLYLSTWSAFGFYQLLPQSHAGIFLAVLVFESMLVAVIYRSVGIAIAAVLGGLLTPILLASPHDTYWSLFSYLAILNVGVVAASVYRRWPVVASLSYLGTQWLFWGWYSLQYHPEKFAWAIGFQLVIFALYLLHGVLKTRRGTLPVDREELARYAINGLVGFASFYALLQDNYRPWLGTVALAMAVIYAWAARLSLLSKSKDHRLLLTSLALSLGFIAWALPLQANAGWYGMSRWVAMGWAIIGLALWRFGIRIESLALRMMAGVLGGLAVGRVLIHDLAPYTREPFIPIFNSVAFPSLIVAGCILYAVVSANRWLPRFASSERMMIGVAGVTGVVLLWLVLSFECYGFFVSRSLLDDQIEVWRWRGQLALTVFWTAFATVLLVLGFWLDRARLRWLAIGLYVITVSKLFLFDMANVQQIYRILGFFVLAVVLGLVARAYQRFK